MRNYEVTFILTPVVSESQLQEISDKFYNYLTNNGANIYNRENWGLKKLAYPMQKKNSGHYHYFEFEADPQILKGFETEFQREERVMRHLVVALDKHSMLFNERRRNGEFNTKKKETPKEKDEDNERERPRGKR